MYHANITENHRERKVARVRVAPVVTRALDIVNQTRFLPVAHRKVST